MKRNRRDFLKITGMAGVGMTASRFFPQTSDQDHGNTRVMVEKATVNLEDGRTIAVPYWRIESGREGPSLGMIAAQHGNEVQGAEIALRFKNICERELVSGSVRLVPMSNILAVRSRKHSFNLGPEENNAMNPEKLHNMQRHWPGDPGGNDTARLAYAIDQAVLKNCSHLVDMHNWNHFRASEALSEDRHESSRKMGEVSASRFISYRNTVIPDEGTMMVSQMMLGRGAGVLVMELSGQFRMNERSIQTGLDSMINIAKMLGMIRGNPETVEGKRAVSSNPEMNHLVKAPCNGIFMPAAGKDRMAGIAPEDFVEEGEVIGHIIRENNLETVRLTAPVTGYIAQIGACHRSLCDTSLPAQHPYTEEGETVVHIVSV